MQYDEFVGRVQHKCRLASRGEAVAAIRATFETLAERLAGGEARHLAAELPRELGIYLRNGLQGTRQRFSLPEFYARVGIREHMSLPKAIHHARSVMGTVQEAISNGEFHDIRCQLPESYNGLFEYTEQAVPSQGRERTGRKDRPQSAPPQANHASRVRDVETRHPEVISPEAPLTEAARKMKELDIGILPVCDGERIVGMVTDRDVTIRAVPEAAIPGQQRFRM